MDDLRADPAMNGTSSALRTTPDPPEPPRPPASRRPSPTPRTTPPPPQVEGPSFEAPPAEDTPAETASPETPPAEDTPAETPPAETPPLAPPPPVPDGTPGTSLTPTPEVWPTRPASEESPTRRSRLWRAIVDVSPRHPVRHLTLLALVLVLLGAAAGFAGSALVTPLYAAQADILYTITREQPTGFLREDRNLSTQLVVLRSRSVLERVAGDNGLEVADLAARITPTVLQESEVIHIELRDPDQVRARVLLEEVTAQYLELSNNFARSETQDYLDGQLRDVLGRIDLVPVDVPARASERAALVSREQELRSQLDTLQLTEIAGPAAEVLVPAYVDPVPVYPRTGFATGTGALAGLLVAVIGVAVLARRAHLR